jgi:hypothetical protein
LQTATAVAALETATPASYPASPQPQVAVMSAKANVIHGIATSVVTASPQVETWCCIQNTSFSFLLTFGPH